MTEIAVPPVPGAAELTTAVLEEVGVTELTPPAAADPPIVLPAVPAPTTAAEPVVPGADAVPPPEPVAEELEETVAPDPPPPVVAQTRPVNVNVSVRVDSPGDNGAVTQVNVAAGAAPAARDAPPQYQPDPPQYQAPIPVEPAGDEPALHAPDPGPGSATPETWDWTWTWGCEDDEVPVPLGTEAFARSWNWKWNWNCDTTGRRAENNDEEIGAQYQQPVTQYQPINVNVSIRFNSPGDDGPVVQANVAVAVASPDAPDPPPVPIVPIAPVAPIVPAASVAAIEGHLEVSALSMSVTEAPPQDVAAPQAARPAAPADDCCAASPTTRARAEIPAPQSVVLRRPPPTRRVVTARLRPAHVHPVRHAAAAGAGAGSAAAAQRSARTLRPAPRRASFDPSRESVLVLGSGVLAPLAAPDRGVGFTILLLLAVGFAFAAASSTVAREARAPTAEPGQRPERPG